MVLIHFKKTEQNQFLYETQASIQTEVLIQELVFGIFISKINSFPKFLKLLKKNL